MINKIRTIISIAVAVLFFFKNTNGQGSQRNRLITVHKTTSKIITDGMLDEAAWKTTVALDSFINKWPTDKGTARLQTEVKIFYDDQFIYFGIKAYLGNSAPVIQSLKRDVNPYYSDGVSVVIDPSGKNTSGYTFGVNAAGAQMEGIVEVNSASFDWDTKWYSGTKMFNGYWTAELAIPFKSFRFPKSKPQWGINFIRNDMTNNCFSTWNQVPIQFFGANLNCLGKIIFADDAPQVKSNNVFIPYVSAKADEEQKVFSSSFNTGIDAKIAINSSLNLAATINPDFSQVDVDRQIINLDRFNVLLPERRTFFLENSDLFSNMGLPNTASPFVSRRIGLTDDGRIVPVIAGLRLTGNVSPALRIGLMNIQSEGKYGQAPQNYTVAAFDHKIFKRSNLRGLVTNRQQVMSSEEKDGNTRFNRVAGTEFNFLSNNTKFNGRAGYYNSFNPGQPTSSGFGLASIGYTDKRLNISAGWSQVNSNFVANAGFTPRLYNYDADHDTTVRIGYNNYNSALAYSYYPKSKAIINSIDFLIKTNQYYTVSNQFIEYNNTAGLNMLFANRREAAISYTRNSVNLPFPTTLFTETGNLQKATYTFDFLQLKYLSNFLRPFSWGLTVEHGGYYNGKRTTYAGSVKYRSQPWGNFSADFIYNNITLNDKKIHPFILGPTVELTFSNTLSWTTFLQYNTQIKNFNLNSRFQWRFKPMSDIYLVYADNYLTDGLVHKSRNLVFKISYWIN
ncbi:MAG: carbohydrate binding family 9 domain-containing protein [Rhizobacter sp.]|nr:carbohydrate binding family 9 domain-containing protein [Ferruginibacter sp.]